VGRLPEGPVLATDYCELEIVGIERRAVEVKKGEVEIARQYRVKSDIVWLSLRSSKDNNKRVSLLSPQMELCSVAHYALGPVKTHGVDT